MPVLPEPTAFRIQAPYGLPRPTGFTLEPQGMPVQNFWRNWGPRQPFVGPLGPGPVAPPPPGPWSATHTDTGSLYAPAANPIDAILPPSVCPQPCPVTVQASLCRRPAIPRQDTDAWGDPRQLIPPGVRTIPEWSLTGIKKTPGGPILVGKGGMFVAPSPLLPSQPRGRVVAAGEEIGLLGAVYGADNSAVIDESLGARPARPRVPLWGWALGALVLMRMVRR